MNRRTVGISSAILLVVCFGLVFSVVYPFTTSVPLGTSPPGERFTVETTAGYRATGSIAVDGTDRLRFEGVVTPDGAWYQRFKDGDVVSEEFKPAGENTVYRRLSMKNGDRAEQRLERIRSDENLTLVHKRANGTRVTVVVKKNLTGATEPVSGTASVFVNSLLVAGYAAEGTNARGEIVYEPRSGWYDGEKPYRITDASGSVRVDADTRGVTSANVSWDVTKPAGTYAEYALVRLTSDDPTTFRITFDLEPGVNHVERPNWVDGTDSG